MSHMDAEKVSVLLPCCRKFEVIDSSGTAEEFEATIRVDISSVDDIKLWISDLSKAMSCNFIVVSSKKPKKANVKLYRLYVCSLSCRNKTRPVASTSLLPDLTERNYGCGASVAFWIMEGDDYALRSMAAKVHIKWRHSHKTDTAHFLSLLRPLDETKETFLGYFDNAQSVNDAIRLNQNSLASTYKENAPKYLASKAYNPSKNIVGHWYQQWREARFGTWDGSYDALKEKEKAMLELGVVYRISADPLAVLIVTPIMQRAHTLSSASDICFVDSTSTCDAAGHSLTFMLTATSIGAIPLAIFITSNQTEASYESAFNLLKEAMEEKAFGGTGGPKIFLTDDSIAETKALASVWPNSEHQNCIFHIAQAQWRWLFEAKNKVKKEHRQQMMNDFRRIMFSVTANAAEEAYTMAVTNIRDLGDYDHCMERLNRLWERRVDWVIAYRDHHSRGNFTNNFAEITVRIFKDNVLHRRKSYNAASLTDVICTDLEEYYRNRLLDFSNCRSNSPFLKLENMMEKASYVTSKDVVETLQNGVYLVPSEDGDKKYEVDTSLGCCSCPVGMFGKFCKHAAVILKFFEDSFPNRPSVSSMDRYRMAVIALGDKAPPSTFYAALNETGDGGKKGDAATSHNSRLEPDHSDCAMDEGPSQLSLPTNTIDPMKARRFTEALLQELLDNGSNEQLAAALDRFSAKFFTRCQGQPSRLATLLNSAASSVQLRNRAGAKIPVQPTAKSRRKNMVTRGTSSRLTAGRVASVLAKKAKCGRVPTQKLRNLGRAVRENRPNAKSHT